LARPKDARVITKRDGRGLGAAADLGEACQLGSACPQLLWRAIDRVPGGPELDGAAERGPAVPPDPDRWVWLLQRFGLEDESAELRVLTSKRRLPTGPKLTHRSRYSSVMAPRSAKGTPSATLSAATQPAPIPRMKRPPLSASSDETILAVTTGFRYGTMRTVVPSRTRLVAPAKTASATSGAKNVSPKLATVACRTT